MRIRIDPNGDPATGRTRVTIDSGGGEDTRTHIEFLTPEMITLSIAGDDIDVDVAGSIVFEEPFPLGAVVESLIQRKVRQRLDETQIESRAKRS